MDEKLLELLKAWVEELVNDEVGKCDNRHSDWDGSTGAYPERAWEEVLQYVRSANRKHILIRPISSHVSLTKHPRCLEE